MEQTTSTKASRLNERVMEMLEEALEDNPEVNLLSIIPPEYQDRISNVEPPQSYIAQLNQSTIYKMTNQFVKNPDANLSSLFAQKYQRDWDRRIKTLDPSELERILGRDEAKQEPKEPPDKLEGLKEVTEATILFPLSTTLLALLQQGSDSTPMSSNSEEILAAKMKHMFESSTRIFEFPIRGAVLRCGGDIVAKVTCRGRPDTTEYTSLQYLAQYAPDLPVPKPHGLVKLGSYLVTFMSYIPSMTLTTPWPSMTHDQKVAVQRQLEDIFYRLRQLKKPDGLLLGGVNEEGVRDRHRDVERSDKVIATVADFEDWKFSLSKFSSDRYTEFLRGFLPSTAHDVVFTHGDLRPDNIMVDGNQDGEYSITGIIDWEDSGFYPDYHECTKTTNTLISDEKSDWYQYLPPCIAPRSFPVWWLTDRLWDRNILYSL